MILVVEDKHSYKSIIGINLKDLGYKAKICNQVSKVEKIINESDSRLVIIDRNLSEIDGIVLCKQLRELNLRRYIYIIMITDDIREDDLKKIFSAGADDYLPNVHSKDELNIRITIGLRMLELEDKLNKTRKKLIKVARVDPLTGLLNRRSFMDEAINELERATREHRIVSVIMIEIDNFKKLVDKHGFEARDALLTELSVRLLSFCRSYDKVAHYGGGVFVLLLPNTRTKTASRITKRIQTELSGREFYLMGDNIKITACYGVSLLAPDLGLKDAQLSDLIKRTELSLKKAKSQGANKIAVEA